MHRWPLIVGSLVAFAAAVGVGFATLGRRADPLADGQAAYRRSDWSSAALAARRRLKAAPDDPAARLLLARASARLGRRDYAQGLYERLPSGQMRGEDYYLIGSGLLEQGEADVAWTLLRRALEADPDHPEALHAAARLALNIDRLEDAGELSERLSRQPRWEAAGQALLARAADAAGDPARAAAAWDRAVRSGGDFKGAFDAPAAARRRQARTLLRLGRPEEAMRHVETLLAAGPDPEAAWLAGRAALQRGDRAAYEAAAAEAVGYAPDPSAPEPAPHVGAVRCAGCHEDIHRMEQGSRHAKTFRPGPQISDWPLPDGPVPDPDDPKVVHRLARDGSRIALSTTVGDETLRAWLISAIGSGDRGLTPLARDEQGRVRELRLSYYGDIRGWDLTTGQPPAGEVREVADHLGSPLDADQLRRCLGCHATEYRAARDGEGPTVADRGIGCERCHGPGGHHPTAAGWKLADPAIGRPGRLPPAESSRICAECHSPRGRPLGPDEEGAIRFQSMKLPRSRCFTESRGALGCVTCHNPHRDADTDSSYYEARCLACHGPADSPPTALRHTLPDGVRRVACPVEPSANCLECHMPQTKTAVPHTVFTDHHIRAHRPADARSSGAR